MIKQTVNVFLFFLLFNLLGCISNAPTYHPGGPYYYKSDIANYQLHRPNGEITKAEANKLARDGYAYYIAHFNSAGRPTSIEKHYKGKIMRKVELIYKNDQLVKTIFTDANGHTTEESHAQ